MLRYWKNASTLHPVADRRGVAEQDTRRCRWARGRGRSACRWSRARPVRNQDARGRVEERLALEDPARRQAAGAATSGPCCSSGPSCHTPCRRGLRAGCSSGRVAAGSGRRTRSGGTCSGRRRDSTGRVAAAQRIRGRTAAAALEVLRERVAVEQHARVDGEPRPDGDVVLHEDRPGPALAELRRLLEVVAGAKPGCPESATSSEVAPAVREPEVVLLAELVAAAGLQLVARPAQIEELAYRWP